MKIDLTPQELVALIDSRKVRPPREILMAHTAYEECFYELSEHQPEFAGVLLGPVNHRSVTHFVADTTGEGTPSQFRVGAARINDLLRQYVPLGLEAKGFAHSHPPHSDRLSAGDLDYVRRLFKNPKNRMDEVLMPIVTGDRFIPFVIKRTQPLEAIRAELVLF